jgi:ABC-type transporter Mla MlaB component
MADPELGIEFGGAGRIELSGMLVNDTASAFLAALGYWPLTIVEVDLRDLDGIDLDGLAVLVSAIKERPELRLVNPPRQVTRIFEISGLIALLPD